MAASPGNRETRPLIASMNKGFSPTVLLRGLLGALLLWAAVSKLANPIEFLGSIYAYQLPLPKLLLQTAAVALPWLELLLGFLLLIGRWTGSCLMIALLLFVVFIAATGQAWLRGLNISCGCFNLAIFGIDHSSPVSKFLESVAFAFFRNLALAGFTWFVLLRELNSETTPASATTQPTGKFAKAR